MIHYVKTRPEFFQAGLDGIKNFDVRRNDRGYQTGDILVELEIDREDNSKLTGREHKRRITYVLSEWGICSGFVVLSLSGGLDN